MSSSSMNIGQAFIEYDISCHDFVVGRLISGTDRVQLDIDTQALIDASVGSGGGRERHPGWSDCG